MATFTTSAAQDDGYGHPPRASQTLTGTAADGEGTPSRPTRTLTTPTVTTEPAVGTPERMTMTRTTTSADVLAASVGTASRPSESYQTSDLPTPVESIIGTLIPTAFFRQLRGTVVDEDGDAITDAEWIYSREKLPTGGRVDADGTFSLYTLKQSYSDFILIGSSGRKTVDYTWYQPVDTEITATENDVELVFRTGKLKGLFGGIGADLGGKLG